MTDSEQSAPAGDVQLTAEHANAKGAELSAAADREKDTFARRQLNTEAQRYFAMATNPQASASPDVQASQKMPAASPAPEGPFSKERGEALMREATGGALTYEQVDTICRDAGPWTRQLEELDDGAYRAAIDKGEAEVERTIYRGNAGAMQEGLQDILGAINKAFGERAPAIVKMLDENAVLANARAHEQVLTWARATLK